jgi:hypothetical protein
MKSSKWLESVQARELHLLLCLNSKKNLERCVTYHMYRKEAKNTKYFLQKYGGTCKYCGCIVKVKCDMRSDFAVLSKMDKAGKVELKAEAQGERAMDLPVIPASNGRKCPSMYLVRGEIDSLVATSQLLPTRGAFTIYRCDLTKLMFNPTQFGIVFSCCLFKIFPGQTRLALKTYIKPLMLTPVTSRINIYQCDLTKRTLNPNPPGIVVNCCLVTASHSLIVLAHTKYIKLLLLTSVTFKINIYQCYLIKYMFNPNLSGIVYNCCLLSVYLGKITIAHKTLIMCSFNNTCVCVVSYDSPCILIHRGGDPGYTIVPYVKVNKLSNWQYRYRE